MKVTVLERFVILNILPSEGNMLDLRAAANVREAVEFSEKELASLNIEQAGDQLKWDTEAAEAIAKDVDWSGPQTSLIVVTLRKLDAEQKLTPNHLSLCDKFSIGD